MYRRTTNVDISLVCAARIMIWRIILIPVLWLSIWYNSCIVLDRLKSHLSRAKTSIPSLLIKFLLVSWILWIRRTAELTRRRSFLLYRLRPSRRAFLLRQRALENAYLGNAWTNGSLPSRRLALRGQANGNSPLPVPDNSDTRLRDLRSLSVASS